MGGCLAIVGISFPRESVYQAVAKQRILLPRSLLNNGATRYNVYNELKIHQV
jgi:hypothetical protein